MVVISICAISLLLTVCGHWAMALCLTWFPTSPAYRHRTHFIGGKTEAQRN